MTRLFLDIESIPSTEPNPAIANPNKSPEDLANESALSGTFGQIFCIGYAENDKPTQMLCADEKTMLTDFWQLAKNVDLFVGFNILDFDLRFIWQRSVIHQIKPTVDLTFTRGSNNPIYDIMYEWSHWSGGIGSRIGLDGLAQAFGIPSSKNGGITGRTVYKAYKEGRHKEICDYCARDVDVTRAVYKKLSFSL